MINALFTITIIELFLGGGGRLIEIGPGTLRMVLFVACLAATGAAAMFRWRSADGQVLAVSLVAVYLLLHVQALLNGALQGADPSVMFTQVQQSLYWLAAPFFCMVLQSEKMIVRVANVVRLCGLAMAICYIGALLAVASGLINILTIYPILVDTDEFRTRGENFLFYKGFLYLGIGLVFVVALRGRYWKTAALVTSAALVLTLTRGFILSTSVAILLMLFVQGRMRMLSLGFATTVVAGFLALSYLPSLDLVNSRDQSNLVRLEDMGYIWDNASIQTLLVGEGFGFAINQRANIENTFLWVLWKVGLPGLVFWLLPLVLCTRYYIRARHGPFGRLASPFYFSVVLIYVQTATNPYLNNPIGLSFVIIALFSLRKLGLPRTATMSGPVLAPANSVSP